MKAEPKQTNNANHPGTLAAESSRENQSAQPSLISGRMPAQRACISDINDSPRMLAQRRRIEGYLGIAAQQQPIQRLEKPDDEKEETLQPKFASEPPAQLERQASPKPNNTGLPDNLKNGIESLSGMSMDNVKVHYNSSQPAQMNALAYAQGTDIHMGPGQEQHLPHEAWHVVQQAQGRVKPTMQMKGAAINDDSGLEREADVMGTGAMQLRDMRTVAGANEMPADRGRSDFTPNQSYPPTFFHSNTAAYQYAEQTRRRDLPRSAATMGASANPIQAKLGFEFETGWLVDRIPFDYTHDDIEQPQPQPQAQPVPFEKMAVVTNKHFDGFRIEADEAEGGRSEIEFVIRPPLEESPEGLAAFRNIMDRMMEVGEALIANKGRPAPWPLSHVTGDSFDEFVVVTPRDDQLKAGIQPTMGLKLEVVPKFLVNSEQHSEHPKFNGFLNLVRSYIVTGSQNEDGDERPLAYPKMIAEPLLARTNFRGLLELAEPEALQGFGDADKFVDGVLALLDMVAYKAKPLIDRGVIQGDQDVYSAKHLQKRLEQMNLEPAQRAAQISETAKNQAWQRIQTIMARETGLFYWKSTKDSDQEEARQAFFRLAEAHAPNAMQLAGIENEIERLGREMAAMVHKPALTVESWLRSIWNGSDALAQIKDAESMGQFGKRTEAVGPDGVQGGIFEFRGMQNRKEPCADWAKVTVPFFQRILELHDHK